MNIKHLLKIAPLAAALCVALPAGAAPTAQEIAKARASCAAGKQRVQSLESKSAASDPALEQAKQDWESACQQATLLMDERDGKVNPQPQPSTEAAAMEAGVEATTSAPATEATPAVDTDAAAGAEVEPAAETGAESTEPTAPPTP